ncbi:hypothetical protein B296_00040083, partial [Ensete ventricosum]
RGHAAGGGCPLQGRKGGRQPVRCFLKAAAPAVGATAHSDGVQRCYLRRAAAVQMGARRGLGHPFK